MQFLDKIKWRLLILLPLILFELFMLFKQPISGWLCFVALISYLLAIQIHDWRKMERNRQEELSSLGIGPCFLILLLLTGCTIAPHGSRATHQIWTYAPGSRPDGLVRYEKITDRSAGGGAQVGTFTQLQNVSVVHTNSMMRVGGMLTIGNAYIGVDTNTASVVTALGTAAGDVIGAAMKTAVKP